MLAWVNLAPNDATLALTPDLAAASAVEFTLTATATGTTLADLQLDTSFLNGALLSVGEDGMLPVYPLPGKAAPPSKTCVGEWGAGRPFRQLVTTRSAPQICREGLLIRISRVSGRVAGLPVGTCDAN